ncbi:acyl-CoA N-acyltransferase [Clavulina sp. PMI_390]|nr:acyl-CoA N-acyltransferase [Clavulina sp. PMI_390]
MELVDQGRFCFPIPPYIGNDLVELIPFELSKHAHIYAAAIQGNAEPYRWLPNPPINTASDVKAFLRIWVVPDDGVVLFAIKDKTRSTPASPNVQGEVTLDTFAGVIALKQTSVQAATSELGHVLIIPKCQRTHVLTNACGLLLQYTLNRPEEGGLGLRRIQWQANSANQPSVDAAKKLGFQWEGVIRWDSVLHQSKLAGPGNHVRQPEDGRGTGRHTAMLAMCWDDWEGGQREALAIKMILRIKT